MNALRRNGVAFIRSKVEHIEPHAFVGLVSREQYALLIGKPARPAVIDIVLGQLPLLAGTGR